MDRKVATAASCDEFISIGLAIGPPACAARSLARPSQNCAMFSTEFSTVGELMPPFCQRSPTEAATLSLPPMLRLWQELQEMKPERDSRGSKNSFLPSSTLAGSVTLAGCSGWMGSSLADCTGKDKPMINAAAARPSVVGRNGLRFIVNLSSCEPLVWTLSSLCKNCVKSGCGRLCGGSTPGVTDAICAIDAWDAMSGRCGRRWL